MSRTKKDAPYDVRARANGVIEHDHTTGRCIVGTRNENYSRWKSLRAHKNVCPRNVYIAICVHDADRIAYQRKVDAARAAQKSYYHRHPDAWVGEGYTYPEVTPRPNSSARITEMLAAGYIPNCKHAKTHEFDIREVDLGLLPGERVGVDSYGTTSWRVRYNYNRIDILRPGHNPDVACDVCDQFEDVTCYITVTTDSYRRSRYYCSCCDEEEDVRYSNRTTTRDEMIAYAKEYNTFGEVQY